MIAVEVKGINPKFAWEAVGVYRAPNEDMRVIERLAARTGLQETLLSVASSRGT